MQLFCNFLVIIIHVYYATFLQLFGNYYTRILCNFLQLFGNYYTYFIQLFFNFLVIIILYILHKKFFCFCVKCLLIITKISAIMSIDKERKTNKREVKNMKRLTNKKAREIKEKFFTELKENQLSLYDVYEQPSIAKILAWDEIKKLTKQYTYHPEDSLTIYSYNTFGFTAVFYGFEEPLTKLGCISTGIHYITKKNHYFIPDFE